MEITQEELKAFEMMVVCAKDASAELFRQGNHKLGHELDGYIVTALDFQHRLNCEFADQERFEDQLADSQINLMKDQDNHGEC
jgi:hypothetical protein